jgi:myosin-light-chain kinase
MSNSDFWKNYKERKLISSDSRTYQAINIKTGKYEVIKEINKYNVNIEELKKEIERKKNEENIVKINEIKEDNNIFYMIMDLYSFNLENYLKIRDKPLSINEIKEILLQLNKIFKKLNEENIIYGNLKLSNILINLDEINKISIKLCYYDSIKFYKKLESSMSNKINYNLSPEIIKDGIYNNNKSDIWSLGIIIYYMLTKKYLYEGKNEYQLYNNIISQNINDKLSENEELNDLLIKMLKININERISWEEYFNHPFFELNEFPKFNFICKEHSKEINYYCIQCKLNICDFCLNNHKYNSHEVIPFNQIGFNEIELNKIEILLNNIEDNMNKLKKFKEDIKLLINRIKLNKDNISTINTL